MKPIYGPEAEAYRDKVQAFLAEKLPADWGGTGRLEGDALDEFVAWWRGVLYDAGYLAPGWPLEYGGGGLTALEQVIIAEEFARAGVPTGGPNDVFGIQMLGNTLLQWGTEEQKRRYLPRILAGEDTWCQGYSEPNAGSDLGGLALRAQLDGDQWVLNGQKIWASRAVWADWCFGIFRTDPEAERHRGLTFVLVPLDSPGVTVRPIAQLDGDTGFAEIFFDDVHVPVENTLGDVHQGWRVAMATAGFERGVSLRSPARFSAAADRLVGLWRQHADPSDTALRDAVVDAWMQAEGYRLHTYMTVTHMIEGGTIGAEASLNKIFWSEMDVRIHELALDIVGPEAERMDGSFERWVDGFLFSLSGPIYAGTNEIQRNIIADRVLQLPKGV